MATWNAGTVDMTTAQTLPPAAEKWGAFFHINAPIDVKATNVVATDTPAIQSALNRAAGTGGGRPTKVRLICGPDHPGAVSIDQTLVNSKGGVWLESDARGSTGSGVRLKWVGAAGGKMAQVTNVDAGFRNIVFDANSLAATCVEYLNSERQGYEDIGLYNFTGEGLIIGNGTPNNNGFRGKGTLYLVGKDGSVPLVLRAASTEDINLDNVIIQMGTGAVAGMLRLIDIANVAHLHVAHLVLDDDFSPGYAIRVGGGGSIGIDDLASEAKQTIEFTAVGRGRSSYILRGDCRSSDPAAGEYAIKFTNVASNTKTLFLGALNINRKAGAANAPDVYINNGGVFAAGVDFTSSDAGAVGKFAPTSTGRVFDASAGSFRVGVGSPEGIVLAPPGTTYQRTDGGSGTSLYIKESAATLTTGWRAP
ncbi:MAG: hypothetical protein LC798_05240 [Chloroflexi bacterium]|nr:hypothetical protein [Chloroflexota bacterium]